MAPNGEVPLMVTAYSRRRPQRLLTEGLERAMSNLSFELSLESATEDSKVEDAKCECCGLSEECTSEYINRVRDKFCRRWVCGLCSEAVKAEMEKGGGSREAALDAHTSVCARFNGSGSTHPVLYQAEAMREILKKYCRAKSCGSRDEGEVKRKREGGIVRSSSCIPALMVENNQQ